MASFEILPVTSMADLPAITNVYDTCSRISSFALILKTEYGPGEDGRALLSEASAKATQEGIEASDCFLFKAVNPEGKIIAYSHWFIGRNRGRSRNTSKEKDGERKPGSQLDVPAAPASAAVIESTDTTDYEKAARKKKFDEIRKPMIDAYYQYCGDQKVVCKSTLLHSTQP